MATLREIAERADVSIATVSDVLNGKYAGMGPRGQKRAKQILELAEKMGYRPNAAARGLRSKASKIVGVIVQTHTVVLETIVGLTYGLQEAGYLISMIPYNQVTADTVDSRAFRERVVDGMIIVDGVPADLVPKLESWGPCVWVNTNVWHAHGCVRRDERQAGREAATAMAELGYRRLCYVGPDVRAHYSHVDRLAGVTDVAAERGLRLTRIDVPPITEASVVDAALPPLTGEDAVLAADAYQARRLQNVFMARRQLPGRDFAFGCCDDAEEFNLDWRELARVKFNREQQGRVAAELMLARLEPAGAGDDAGCPSRVLPAVWMPGDTARPRLDRGHTSEETS